MTYRILTWVASTQNVETGFLDDPCFGGSIQSCQRINDIDAEYLNLFFGKRTFLSKDLPLTLRKKRTVEVDRKLVTATKQNPLKLKVKMRSWMEKPPPLKRVSTSWIRRCFRPSLNHRLFIIVRYIFASVALSDLLNEERSGHNFHYSLSRRRENFLFFAMIQRIFSPGPNHSTMRDHVETSVRSYLKKNK